jgi:hypothetical protein
VISPDAQEGFFILASKAGFFRPKVCGGEKKADLCVSFLKKPFFRS